MAQPEATAVITGLLRSQARPITWYLRGIYAFKRDHIDDVFYETCVRTWQQYAAYDEAKRSRETHFFFLCREVARSKCRLNRMEDGELAALKLFAPEGAQDSPAENHETCTTSLLVDLCRILAELSPEETRLITSHAKNSTSESGIRNFVRWSLDLADELGMTPNEVKASVYRLKEHLYQQMIRHGHDVQGVRSSMPGSARDDTLLLSIIADAAFIDGIHAPSRMDHELAQPQDDDYGEEWVERIVQAQG